MNAGGIDDCGLNPGGWDNGPAVKKDNGLRPPVIFSPANPDRAHHVPPEAILVGYRGSIAHGMFVPSTDPKSVDDVDLMGITVPGPEYYLGLQNWGSRGTKEIWEEPYDAVYYEIRKMFGLLLQGNPNVLSFIWMRPGDYLVYDPLGAKIVAARDLFTGKHVYHAFAGYASAQLQKMTSREPASVREYLGVTYELKRRGIHPTDQTIPESMYADLQAGDYTNCADWGSDKLLQRLKSFQKKGENLGYLGDKRKRLVLEHGYDCKNAAHCVRLLTMCCEFLCDGMMQVNREGIDADVLLAIKRGEWTLEAVKETAENLFENAKRLYEASTLPDEPDHAGAERLLVEIVRERLK